MKILALDTSTEVLTIAVISDGKTVSRFHRKIGRNHASLLVPSIAKMLRSLKIGLDDIDAVAFGAGPGSFTGLRIGAATVKGFAYAYGIPVVSVPTFDAIAMNARKHKGTICVALDARKNKVYGCLYSSDGKNVKRISKYMLTGFDELLKKADAHDKVMFLGDHMAEKMLGQYGASGCTSAKWHPRADVLGLLGVEYLEKGKTVNADELEPMYIYSKECDITGK